MSLFDTIKSRRADILRIAEKHGAHNVRVFGSTARGQETADSDVDFLVDFDADRGLMDHASLLVELEDLLHRRVDVAPASRLRRACRDRILHEARPL